MMEGRGPMQQNKGLLLAIDIPVGIPEGCSKFQVYWLEGRKTAGGDCLASYLVLFSVVMLFLLSSKLWGLRVRMDGWMLKLKLQSPPLQYWRERLNIDTNALILQRDVAWNNDDVASDNITRTSGVNFEAYALESKRNATASDLKRELRRPV